jgi:hypothetical protein
MMSITKIGRFADDPKQTPPGISGMVSETSHYFIVSSEPLD